MNGKIIESCPSCSKPLVITRLSCSSCDTEITGRFTPTIFDRLTPESLAFVETFVRLRGNVKEMERELDVPYTAVRSRLDDVLAELGFAAARERSSGAQPSEKASSYRREVLDQLDRGEIDATEAARRLADPSTSEEGEDSDE